MALYFVGQNVSDKEKNSCYHKICSRNNVMYVQEFGDKYKHLNLSCIFTPNCAFMQPLLETLKICPQNPLMILCGMTQLEDHKEILKV